MSKGVDVGWFFFQHIDVARYISLLSASGTAKS